MKASVFDLTGNRIWPGVGVIAAIGLALTMAGGTLAVAVGQDRFERCGYREDQGDGRWLLPENLRESCVGPLPDGLMP